MGYAPEYIEAMWLMLQPDIPDDYAIGTDETHSVKEFFEGAFSYPNLGTGFEIKIKDLVGMIFTLTGFKGKIVWDSSKPDGELGRKLDTSKAEKEFGFKAKISFEDGLKESIDWYINFAKKNILLMNKT